MVSTPWAIILCTFSDATDQPYPRSRYEEIFTTAGAGKWNMVDYWHDMSHGTLDLSGSQVFGWYTLPKKTSDYVGSGANQQGRQDLLDWGKKAATDAGVDLSAFFRVVVCLNGGYDLFGGGNGVVCGDDGKNFDISGICPSAIGQEMGHGYGLQHSRMAGSDDDYKDRWDAMSTLSADMAPHPIYTEKNKHDGSAVFRIGPGLNMANMWSRGWLDANRIWKSPTSSSFSEHITLRPLHRPDLGGTLGIQYFDQFIEFRVPDRWDAGIPAPAVLVHTFDGDRSYINPDQNGSNGWTVGSKQESSAAMSLFGSHSLIEVTAIDPVALTATVQVSLTRGRVPMHKGDLGPFRTPWIAWAQEHDLEVEVKHAIAHIDGHEVRVLSGTPQRDVLRHVGAFEHVHVDAGQFDLLKSGAAPGLEPGKGAPHFSSPAPAPTPEA